MKRIIVLILFLALICTFSACGENEDKEVVSSNTKDDSSKKETSDLEYYQYDMNEYITVGNYSNEVFKSSEDYGYAIDNFYKITFGEDYERKLTEGNVKSGDITNIDYKGLLDGVAFAGGTATGYDLTIGSNTFIPGFEDGLIGAEIGKQINLNLTFPENYHSADLAGKDVVFEVKINSVTRKIIPTEANVAQYGYKSLEEFEKSAEEYASALCLYYNIYNATNVKSYPVTEDELLYEYAINKYKDLCVEYNMSIADLAAANNMTEQGLYNYVRTNETRPQILSCMVAYYVLQTYDVTLTSSDLEIKRKALEEEYDLDLESIGYIDIIIQHEAAYDKAIEILKEKVVIK